MNIYNIYLDKIIKLIKELKAGGLIELPESLKSINVDIPPPNIKCDISTNVSMVLSKVNKKNPLDLANQLIEFIKKNDTNIESINVAKPGFINIKFKTIFWNSFVKEILNNANNYGISSNVEKKKYLIEFVSANPTGPLHVGHCRGAILGDVIANILTFNKHEVSKEYYVNDYGNQIISFTKSVFYRIREILHKDKFPIENADLYPGDYLKDIAKNIINKNKNLRFDNFESISRDLTVLAVDESVLLIKENLKNLGIIHDTFVTESSLVQNNEVEGVIKKLKDNKLIYEGKIKAPNDEDKEKWVERKQLLFKATNFGDDKDRALQKSDKSWTYFAGDAAYHNNKLNRNYDTLINILGADHAGYIKRISSVVEALSGNKDKLICKVSQLVKLIKDGQPFKMSKRKGDYITVEDLIKEVGKDATRFIMLNRSSDVELDFDFTKVKEKSKDNPLYYVQYCYARIASVFRHVEKDIKDELKIKSYDFNYGLYEINVLKKISEWPKCVETASQKLEPHRVAAYLYDLSSEFHSYWNMGREKKEMRFLDDNKIISDDKLVFLKIISNVIRSGMKIIDVNIPEKM